MQVNSVLLKSNISSKVILKLITKILLHPPKLDSDIGQLRNSQRQISPGKENQCIQSLKFMYLDIFKIPLILFGRLPTT